MRYKPTILVVEDEEPLRELLCFNLRADGYRVFSAGSAERGLSLIRNVQPDLIVLDVRLPGMDGFEMCRLLRAQGDIPVLFLTARKDEIDKVLGLKLGGDDYVTKPFALRELLARIEALHRRSRGKQIVGRRLSAGRVLIDPDDRKVTVRGQAVALCPKEFDLLYMLMAANGKTLSRARIMRQVWGHAQNLRIETRTVDQHVALLRRKLGLEEGVLETVSKGGYRMRTGNSHARLSVRSG